MGNKAIGRAVSLAPSDRVIVMKRKQNVENKEEMKKSTINYSKKFTIANLLQSSLL